MKLSTRGRYAARIMVYMGIRGGRVPVTKHEIAKAEAISVDYVGQILVKLRTAGLVTSFRGKKGGFVLARDPATITIAEIVRATEGPIELAPCREGPCKRESMCAMQAVWNAAMAAVEKVLEDAKLQNIVETAKKAAAERTITFDI